MSATNTDVTSLSDLPVGEIDEIPREDRLAPKPDVDTDSIDSLADLAKELKGRPRSERVQIAFDWRPTDYQALLLDYGESVARAQAAPKKGRQVGATEVAGKIGADYALCAGRTDVLYTAPGQATADEMFDEFKDSFKLGPLTLEQYGVSKDLEQTWKFDSGCRVMSRTLGAVGQDKNPGNRGMNPTCVIVDEAHYEQDKVYTEEIEEFFITHPEYEYYLFSTPAGKSGYFYEKVEQEGIRDFQEAVDTEWSWYSPYWPTKLSPFAQQDFIEKKRQELDSVTFEQEFLGIFAEGEESFLPHETVKPCINPDAHQNSTATRWLGVDPAETGKDRMVIYDLDENGVTRNIWSKQTVTGPAFVGMLTDLQNGESAETPDWGTGETPTHGYDSIVIESNMAGLATDILEAGIGGVVMPVKSTTKSKGPMYKKLKRDLEAGELSIPNYRRLINQMTSLQYSYTPNRHMKIEHPQGGHDDYPDALMLANAGRVGMAREYKTELEGNTQKASPTFGW